ncbi:MAG TPA: TIGR04283 family arsenosugar biosynthesis glycosyltransferase [Gammaproteobacteria bacterium]|nr:TIGR04283 family arsenosugar biosynthesis glycosyltransferase [Gammaproteobacteria bacterium]
MEQVSIVMPALNEAAGIVPVLERLQRCREAGHELILVDGGSADGTGTLAAPFVDTLVRASPGRALQMNAGAARARGGTLWFLHADTLPCTDAVGQILEARSRNGRWGRFDVVIDSPRPLLGVVAAMMNLRSAFTGIATGDQGIFVERALFESLGGFAPLPLMEDIELSRRLRGLARPARLRGPLRTSARRWERAGAWRTIALMWRLRLAYRAGAAPETLARRYGRRDGA